MLLLFLLLFPSFFKPVAQANYLILKSVACV